MNRKTFGFCTTLLMFLGLAFSFFIWLGVTNAKGTVLFSLHLFTDFSFADIALRSAPGEKCYSGIIGIGCYIFFVLLLLGNNNSGKVNRLPGILFLLFLTVLLGFEIYTIVLVQQGNFTGQHLRIPILLFLASLYLYRKGRLASRNI